jgi:hypothetical protein
MNYINGMNIIQKVGLFVWLAVTLILLVLHYPFDGYFTDCAWLSLLGRIADECSTVDGPSFFNWTSKGAVVNGLGSITQLLVWEVVAAGLLLAWIRIFKNTR